MKKLVFILPFLLIAVKATPQDAKAKAILDAVCLQTKSYNTIEIEFTYTMENKKNGVKEVKKGTADMKGEKYWVSFAGQTIISDGKTQWTYIKDNNEVQISTVDPNDDQSLNPSKLLTAYNKSFTPKFIKEEIRNGKTIQILDLTPLKGRSYYKIRLEIDKTAKQIVNSIVYDKNGTSVYTYSVVKFIPNKAVPETKFTFRAAEYPGVEIIDLR
jgi:outer membrane lipoprotein-sorting protein